MKRSEEGGRAPEASGERIPSLIEAIGRIGASLENDTVLTEAVEGARALTSARYGSIVTIEESGAPREFFTSGITDEEHRAMLAWPDGPRLFEHLRDLERPLRLADFPGFVRSLGFSWDLLPLRAFLGTPMRHRGVYVGNFYLIGKEEGRSSRRRTRRWRWCSPPRPPPRSPTRAPTGRSSARQPRGAGGDLAGGRGGVRRADGRAREHQPRGAAHRIALMTAVS